MSATYSVRFFVLKLPAWTFLKAETSAADAIGEQLGHLDRAHAAADAEMSRLAAARPALLLDTTATADAKLEKHDAEQAAARRVMEATAARRAALEVEWREAEAREAFAKDQAERLALYKEALAAAKERESICAEYEIAAAKVADLCGYRRCRTGNPILSRTPFRREGGRHSDLKPATKVTLPLVRDEDHVVVVVGQVG